MSLFSKLEYTARCHWDDGGYGGYGGYDSESNDDYDGGYGGYGGYDSDSGGDGYGYDYADDDYDMMADELTGGIAAGPQTQAEAASEGRSAMYGGFTFSDPVSEADPNLTYDPNYVDPGTGMMGGYVMGDWGTTPLGIGGKGPDALSPGFTTPFTEKNAANLVGAGVKTATSMVNPMLGFVASPGIDAFASYLDKSKKGQTFGERLGDQFPGMVGDVASMGISKMLPGATDIASLVKNKAIGAAGSRVAERATEAAIKGRSPGRKDDEEVGLDTSPEYAAQPGRMPSGDGGSERISYTEGSQRMPTMAAPEPIKQSAPVSSPFISPADYFNILKGGSYG